MKTAGLLSFFLCLFFLASCNQQAGETTLVTGDIYKPSLFEVNGQDATDKEIDLGEFVLTDDPSVITVKINNDTAYPYTEIDLLFTTEGEEMPSINFVPDENGEIKFPGAGGTCETTLGPKKACEIKILFSPRTGREYKEMLELKFKNYIEPQSKKTTLIALAGMPASIAFTNDTTQYIFGEQVGAAKTPVIERADALTYTKELEIINAGGLTAKNIKLQLAQTCVSVETNLCPTGMGSVYAFTTTCPDNLRPNEKCTMTISYAPKNQDPAVGPVPEDIKEINYRSTLSIAYIKDPTGGTAGLNAYFKSVSTNIEARFKVSINSLDFDVPIISGNRDVRTFRINNLGYREGEIKFIAFRDSGGLLVAKCGPKDGSLLLECRSPADAVLTLDQFPYTVKDRNDCLRSAVEGPWYVNVGGGCVFDFFFQPSVLYITDKPTEFKNWQPEVIYDARWRGAEKIVTKKLFNLSAESKAAARLVLQKVTYDNKTYNAVGEVGPWITDLGRQALQSPSFYKRKPMTITIKNLGSVPATAISMRDGSNNAIPIGGAGAVLGPWHPRYYNPATASSSSCTQIDPGATCSLSLSFAPIGLDTNEKQDQNMFDYIDPDSYTDITKKVNNYKAFFFTYTSGALFTDTNLEGDTDYPPLAIESRIKATLVQKGMLMELGDDTRNKGTFGSGSVAGDKWTVTFYVTNMGTGTVPYMRVLNPPSDIWNPSAGRSYDKKILPTPDFAAKGAHYDCTTLFDIDLTGTINSTAMPETRPPGSFAGLPKDETCVFTVEMQQTDRDKTINPKSCDKVNPPSNVEEAARLFTRELEAANGGKGLWEYCSTLANGLGWKYIAISYFDGDNTAPGALSPNYGNRTNLTPWSLDGLESWPAKFVPTNIEPWMTATLYRPGFTLPALPTGQTLTTYPETWFYGQLEAFFTLENDPLQTNGLIKGGVSRYHVPTMAAWGDRGSYDYIYYIGTYPQGAPAITFPFTIRNYGLTTSQVKNFIPNAGNPPVDNAFSIAKPMSFPQLVGGGGDIMSNVAATPVTFSFNPSVGGEHTMEVSFDYESGIKNEDLIFDKSVTPINAVTKPIRHQKMLVVATVLPTGTFPQLTLDVIDYDVVQNPGAPPTVTQTTTTPTALTWNYTPPTASVIFDTIKLTALPTANDVYAKKTLVFKNQTAFNIEDFKYLPRGDALLPAAKTYSTNLTIIPGESTCSNGMTLNAGANCTLTYKYQPGSADSTDNFVLTAIYKAGLGQYFAQNIGINLMPRSPGFVKEFSKSTLAINIKPIPGGSQITRDSYEQTFGTVTLNVLPKTFVWDQPTGGLGKYRMVNTQPTKASLLLSYHKYLAANSLRGYSPVSLPPTSVIPAAGEYRTHTDGHQYVPIFVRKYTDTTTRVLVEASKGCLFGADENDGAVLPHQKGFSNTTPIGNACYLIVTFNANFEYLQDDVKSNDGDDMRNAATEIWYYSVNRSSTASFWIHFKGMIQPDISTLTGSYTNVKAFDNRTINFEVPKFTPNNAALGTVVGTRIIMATSATALNDPYNVALTSYVDIKPYDSINPQVANFTVGMSNANYYYFRAVAIRKDVRFNANICPAAATCRFKGLAAGEYLSAGSNTVVKVLVPPTNHYYFHTQKVIVDKGLTGGVTYDPYATSSGRCTSRAQASLRDPGVISRPYKLIDLATWNLLVATPAATTYGGMTQIAHWLSDAPVSIDTKCSAMPGFVPNSGSQLLDASYAFYLRSSSNPNANVPQAAGGVPGTTSSNYNSYVDGTVGFGSARCMATLP